MAKKIVYILFITLTVIFTASCSKNTKLKYNCGEQFKIKSGYKLVAIYPHLIIYKDYEYVMKEFIVYDNSEYVFDLLVDDELKIRFIRNVPPHMFKIKKTFCVPEGYNVYSTINDFNPSDIVSEENIPFIGKLLNLKSGYSVSFSENETENQAKSVKIKALTQIYLVDKSYFYLLSAKFEKNYFDETFLKEREKKLTESIEEDKKKFQLDS